MSITKKGNKCKIKIECQFLKGLMAVSQSGGSVVNSPRAVCGWGPQLSYGPVDGRCSSGVRGNHFLQLQVMFQLIIET